MADGDERKAWRSRYEDVLLVRFIGTLYLIRKMNRRTRMIGAWCMAKNVLGVIELKLETEGCTEPNTGLYGGEPRTSRKNGERVFTTRKMQA